MPRKTKELSATEVRRLTFATSKNGKTYNAIHPVGGVSGLYLQVTPTESKSWLLRAMVGTKRRDIGLGGFPEVTLAQAREKARETKEAIRNGIDPVEQRREAQRALVAVQLANVTFSEASDRCIKLKAKEFSNPRQEEQWRSSLETYAMPIIGNIPVAEIELPHIKRVLDPIWETKTETANRVRSRIENILGWAATHGYRSIENPAQWKGFLDKVYPSPSKLKKEKHHEAMAIQELPEFIAKLRTMKGNAARALELLILTASRTNEVIGDRRINKMGIQWHEIDFTKRLWTIPAERMKSSKAHTVPLCERAIEILEALPRDNPEDMVFVSPKGIPSNNYMTAVLKRMGINVTVHGFRSTFKDWAREHTAYADEISELALAHVNSDATRAAYARSQLIDKRRRLMNDWEQFCNTTQPIAKNTGKIATIR